MNHLIVIHQRDGIWRSFVSRWSHGISLRHVGWDRDEVIRWVTRSIPEPFHADTLIDIGPHIDPQLPLPLRAYALTQEERAALLAEITQGRAK